MNKHDIIKKMLKKNVTYTIQNKSMCFLPGDHKPMTTAGNTLLGKIQDKLKHWGWIYSILLGMFKPVWMSKKMKRKLHAVLQRHGKGSAVLNLGSGPILIRNHTDIINVDLYAFDEVDMIADATDLPLADASVDLILNQSMLEHVQHPEIVVNEMHRLLRSDGEVFCYLPFIAPFHAAPYDFYRWTMSGVHHLFRQFDQIEIGIGAGPTSGALWVIQEWLAILISFGSRRLHDIIFLILMVLTAPIKMLDILLIRYPYAEKIASGFYISAIKKGRSE